MFILSIGLSTWVVQKTRSCVFNAEHITRPAELTQYGDYRYMGTTGIWEQQIISSVLWSHGHLTSLLMKPPSLNPIQHSSTALELIKAFINDKKSLKTDWRVSFGLVLLCSKLPATVGLFCVEGTHVGFGQTSLLHGQSRHQLACLNCLVQNEDHIVQPMMKIRKQWSCGDDTDCPWSSPTEGGEQNRHVCSPSH